jgi:hypothetical protein
MYLMFHGMDNWYNVVVAILVSTIDNTIRTNILIWMSLFSHEAI